MASGIGGRTEGRASPFRINAETQLCAVIGRPVGHSLSPHMHNAAYQAAGLNVVYLAFEVTDVAGFLGGMRAMAGFRGVSVTIPHKQAVMAHLDEIEPLARHVGSVNTITNEDGRLVGSTTDGPGTLRAFEEAGVSLAGRKILFLGAGGAVRAVAFAMAETAGASQVTILARDGRKAEALAGDVRGSATCDIHAGDLDSELTAALETHDVIVQGTPVGMHPDTAATLVPAEALCPEQVVFDMVYRPHKTRLIRDAEAVGCRTVYGIEMLVHQAVLQFERWTGVACPVDAMRTAAMAELSAG